MILRTDGKIREVTNKWVPFPLLLAIPGALLVFLGGGMLGTQGASTGVLFMGVTLLVLLLVLRLDELWLIVILAIGLYLDSYLVFHVVWLIMALTTLCIFYLARSSKHPWVTPRALHLWILFIMLAVFPAINGALTLHDMLIYYPNDVFGALIIFWLGSLVARNTSSIRRLFQMLALFGALIAIHTIIQTITGITLFDSARADAYIQTTSNYQLATGLTVFRNGSFFVDPNWNGTFLGLMLFIPLGLFVESTSFLRKLLYIAEMLMILPALLFTYSTGAWIGVGAGMIAFIIFVGRMGDRIQLSIIIIVIICVMATSFSTQIGLQFQHASRPDDLPLRIATWQTAWRTIQAFPLTGVGLGHLAYIQRSEPYRVPAEYVPVDHPHNSYLEWGAMAGLPVLAVFLTLVLFAFWLAVHNWTKADVRTRSLLGGGLASIVALSVNSWSINGWTLPPIGAVGWLILGAVSSPLLKKSLYDEAMRENKSDRPNDALG